MTKHLHEPPLHQDRAFTPEMVTVLSLLHAAAAYASELGSPAWEFAVELDALLRAGANLSIIRWLLAHSYAEHRVEKTSAARKTRSFSPVRSLTFPKQSCFVITQEGAEALREHAGSPPQEPEQTALALAHGLPTLPPQASQPKQSQQMPPPCRPHWDDERLELRTNGILVKHFTQAAWTQMTILRVFQEEDWPRCIDNPIPPEPGMDERERLRAIVRRLNHQLDHVIRFWVANKGESICWEPVKP